ncbi:hypothetical protein FRB94_009820 [Tulasnella sp. JGI-2019a]|nr:hypothetical protein FRB94_009820 [Tulasnella sp. JGI-2019a]KAG9025809.1 hypothetical protein FRB95_009761 [Tulasnella sp. JGI-2019a]
MERDISDADRHKYPPTRSERYKSATSEPSTPDHIPEFVPPNASIHPPYDNGNRPLVFLGLALALVAGSAYIIIGIVICAKHDKYIFLDLTRWEDRALGLCSNVLVTACTEATGYVHGTTLKWGLAKEGRLRFNANLRLFSATKGAFSVNGTVVSVIFTITIIISYAASSTIFIHEPIVSELDPGHSTSLISFFPPLILGIALVLQAVLSLIAFSKTHVPT